MGLAAPRLNKSLYLDGDDSVLGALAAAPLALFHDHKRHEISGISFGSAAAIVIFTSSRKDLVCSIVGASATAAASQIHE